MSDEGRRAGAEGGKGERAVHYGRRHRLAHLTLADYVSLTQRVVMVTILITLRSLGILHAGTAPSWVLDVGIAVMLVVAVYGAVALFASDLEPRRLLRFMLAPDLLSATLIIWATGTAQDPLYPWIIGLALIYSVGLAFGESLIYAMLFTGAYAAGHFLGHFMIHDVEDYVFIVFKALAVVVTAVIVGEASRRQVAREEEARRSERTYHDLNRNLQRRLTEIRAVSDINEVIHSTLDFERVGHLVLEIVSKVINVPASALFVIDKRRDETLYSASFGVTQELADEPVAAFYRRSDRPDDTFACTTVLDRGNLMVIFCASGEKLEKLSQEDRLMLAAVANDLTVAVENSELYKLTKKLSITDELTGLFNYRYLLQRMDEEIERARRFARPLSLLMIDADNFKLYNDTHGHIAGDGALADLATVLRGAVRDIDVVCRYGGEEFAVLLPETGSEGAFVTAEKLREAVAAHRFPDGEGGASQRITISVGLTSYPGSAGDREGLLRQADHALYTAKRTGRNRVSAWSASMGSDALPSPFGPNAHLMED